MTVAASIYPVHPSIRSLLRAGNRIRPRGMERMKMSPEMIEAAHRISMDIFVDCTNVGVPFQEALVAIYLSGINHGAAAARDSERG